MADSRWPGRWFRLEARLAAGQEDDAIGLLAGEGCLGTATRAAGPGRVTLTVWFESRDAAERGAKQLSARQHGGVAAPEVAEEVDTGWLAASLKAHPPIAAGRFVVVESADGVSAAPAGRVAVVIPRGRAFGTGEHQTTRLCLELVGERMTAGAVVADVGTGSGVLGIAAALGGARRVLACDDDPAVMEVARENVALNGVSDRVEVREGSWRLLPDAGPFDLVVANIHRTGVVKGAKLAARSLAPDGAAVLSGFVEDDAGLVEKAWAEAGLRVSGRRRDGEWAVLALERRSR
jgi:ribosomal protein L11 methyltransferase